MKLFVLIDVDHTLLDTQKLVNDFKSIDKIQDYLNASQNSIQSYLFPNALKFLKTISNTHNTAIFSEGPLPYQQQKIKNLQLQQFTNQPSIITAPHQKTKIFDQIKQNHTNIVLIDDKPTHLDQAFQNSITTIRVKTGKYKATSTQYPCDFTVSNLDQILDLKVLDKISQPIKFSKNIHLIGAKGVGVTALACCLKNLKKNLTGSDTKLPQITDPILKSLNISTKNFSPKNITSDLDLVIYSGAYQKNSHPELIQAAKKNIYTLSQAQALAQLMVPKDQILVCGVGGKTTTTGMMVHAQTKLKLKPSWFIGTSQINNQILPGKIDSGKYFIAEADEYAIAPPTNTNPKFSLYQPKVIVCTNLVHDHPDIYDNLEQTRNTFAKFFNKLPKDGLLLINYHTTHLKSLINKLETKAQVQTFGTAPMADWYIKHTANPLNWQIHHRQYTLDLKLKVPGLINAQNATAVIASNFFLGHNIKKITNALHSYTGVKRRLELIQTKNDIHYYDDYAHHPKEITGALKALKSIHPKSRLITIFHPHTFSRTKALLQDFSTAFTATDQLIIAPIFSSAREKQDQTISSPGLVKAIKPHNPNTLYLSDFDHIIDHIKKISQPNDVIVTMGAGNIYQSHKQL